MPFLKTVKIHNKLTEEFSERPSQIIQDEHKKYIFLNLYQPQSSKN